ncbi:hypothetical protein ACIOWG_17435 [Streptomyces sp. NPDC087658]|uniref:hypothetical protein n=1 Tax=Streptomyces sp. NPDC087658 TaxID=3365800 RepID=UPI0038061F38
MSLVTRRPRLPPAGHDARIRARIGLHLTRIERRAELHENSSPHRRKPLRPWWGAGLVGELVRQAAVAVVDLCSHAGVLVELLGDALGAHSGLVVLPAGALGPGPQGAATPDQIRRNRTHLDNVEAVLAGAESNIRHDRSNKLIVAVRREDLQ